MKMDMKERKQDFIKIFVIVTLTVVAMYLFWNIKLQGYSMPIQHTVNYSGKFTTRIGAVREIVIQYEKMENPVEIDIVVYDSKYEKCWEKSYGDVVITGKNQTLDSFEKENPLELPEGLYYSQFLMDGENKGNLNCRFIEYSGSYKELYTILCILLILGEIIIFLMSNNEEIPLEKVYFCVAIVLGIALNFVMPPLGVPDEQSHFMEAYELSSKIMRNEQYDERGYLMIREEDYNSIFYLHNAASIAEWYDSFHMMNESEKLISSEYQSTVSTKAPYTYFASAVGITIARWFGLSGHMLLIMGRICNLLSVVAMVSIAIRVIPFGKEFLFVLGLFPEILYLFTSYSYDGMNIALCVLIVAYFLFLYNEKEKIALKELAILGLLILLMLPIKVVYVFFAVLIVMLPLEKVNVSKKMMATIVVVAMIGIIVFVGISCPAISWVLGDLGQKQLEITPESRITLGYAVQNMLSIIGMYLNTIGGYTGTYFSNSFGEIVGSHRYDGLDCYTLPIGIIIIVTVFVLIALEDTRKNEIGIMKRYFVLGGAILTFVAVLTSMLFGFTTVAANRIMGLQGRYFLPVFVLVPLMIKNNFFEIKGNKRVLLILGMGGINLFVVFSIFFHYAHNYFA